MWTHDGDDAERYGLAPNFGCCTANFNQGWPKLAQHSLFTAPPTADGKPAGVVVGVLAPLSASLPSLGMARITVETAYPFDDDVHIVTSAASVDVPVWVRVPGWAAGSGGSAQLILHHVHPQVEADAQVMETASAVGGRPRPRQTVRSLEGRNGTLVLLGVARAGDPPLRATLRLSPRLRFEQWSAGGYSVHRGPLMFSMPVAPNFTLVTHHWGTSAMSNDYDVSNASSWQYALVANASNPDATLTFTRLGGVGAAPFNRTGVPVAVRAIVRPLPSWSTTLNSASAPPPSPACASAPSVCGHAEEVLLVPHGTSDLRIGMFPLA